MPTPLEILLDPVSLAALAMAGGLMVWEWIAPGRRLPVIAGWKLRSVATFVVFFFLSTYLPLLWDNALGRSQLFDLTFLGTWGGFAVGLLVYEAVTYAWHRSMHGFAPLWRGVHQMHHSAERLEALGAFYFSPLDMIGWTFAGSFALVLIVGVTPAAATLLLLTITFLGLFQHANVRTPQWLGYIIQRPESHTVHHARGFHGLNYADLPIFDMAFGTFRNPKGFEHETGFYDGASERILDMILFKDVANREPEPLKAVAN